jgi:hypothetical protein
MRGNRPRACKLGAIDAGAEQKRRTRSVTKHNSPARSYAGVPAVFQWHTCVSRKTLRFAEESV